MDFFRRLVKSRKKKLRGKSNETEHIDNLLVETTELTTSQPQFEVIQEVSTGKYTSPYHGPDVIEEWFDRGMHHILGPIFLSLSLPTLLACKDVSEEWKRIVLFYHHSQSQRIVHRVTYQKKIRLPRSSLSNFLTPLFNA